MTSLNHCFWQAHLRIQLNQKSKKPTPSPPQNLYCPENGIHERVRLRTSSLGVERTEVQKDPRAISYLSNVPIKLWRYLD